jgi:hypothetical protein
MNQQRIRSLETVFHQAMTDRVRNREGEMSPATMYSVNHVDAVNHKEEIFTQSIAPGTSPETLAELVNGRAETHAAGSTDKQTYELVFFYGDDKPRRAFRFPIMAPLALSEHGVEESSARGLVKTALGAMAKTLEITFTQQQAAMDQMVSMMDATTRAQEQLNMRYDRTREERDAAVDYIAKQNLEQMDHSHEQRLKEIEKQKDAEFKAQILKMLPALANAFLPIFPAATADTALLKMVMGSLEKAGPQSIAALQGVLDPPVFAAVATRAMQFKKEEEEAKAKRDEAIRLAGEVKVPRQLAEPSELPRSELPPRVTSDVGPMPSADSFGPPSFEVPPTEADLDRENRESLDEAAHGLAEVQDETPDPIAAEAPRKKKPAPKKKTRRGAR